MLRPLHEMKGYVLAASDGKIGKVKDFVFDEEHWTVRYMVADTGRWIPRRKVLISPMSLDKPDWDEKVFNVNLTKEEIKNQPDLDSDAPVSRQYEKKWLETYEYPLYWQGTSYAWAYGLTPTVFANEPVNRENVPESPEIDDSVLRSLEEIRGYRVVAKDGRIGRVEDLVMDEETWAIRYVVVDVRKEMTERAVLLAPDWFESFDWHEETLQCSLDRNAVMTSPPFNPMGFIKRGYEQELYSHYSMDPYWSVTG